MFSRFGFLSEGWDSPLRDFPNQNRWLPGIDSDHDSRTIHIGDKYLMIERLSLGWIRTPSTSLMTCRPPARGFEPVFTAIEIAGI